MKKIIVLLICIFPINLKSQSKLDFSVSLDYSHIYFGKIELLGTPERGRLNYHFNFNYNHKLKDELWLKIGLGFASLGFSGYKNIEVVYYNPNPSKSDSDLPSFDTFVAITQGFLTANDFKKKYYFLDIPFALRYEFSTEKIKPFIEFGFSTMYYLQSETIFFLDKEKVNVSRVRYEDVNSIQIAPTLAFGSCYFLNEKWEFFYHPNFRYHLTSLRRGSKKGNFWSAGLAIGIRMKLK